MSNLPTPHSCQSVFTARFHVLSIPGECHNLHRTNSNASMEVGSWVIKADVIELTVAKLWEGSGKFQILCVCVCVRECECMSMSMCMCMSVCVCECESKIMSVCMSVCVIPDKKEKLLSDEVNKTHLQRHHTIDSGMEGKVKWNGYDSGVECGQSTSFFIPFLCMATSEL